MWGLGLLGAEAVDRRWLGLLAWDVAWDVAGIECTVVA